MRNLRSLGLPAIPPQRAWMLPFSSFKHLPSKLFFPSLLACSSHLWVFSTAQDDSRDLGKLITLLSSPQRLHKPFGRTCHLYLQHRFWWKYQLSLEASFPGSSSLQQKHGADLPGLPTQDLCRPVDKGDAASKEIPQTSKSSRGKESWEAPVSTGLTKILPLAHLFQLSFCPVKHEAGRKLSLACHSVQRRSSTQVRPLAHQRTPATKRDFWFEWEVFLEGSNELTGFSEWQL